MSARHTAAPLAVPLWTPGVGVMIALMIPGLIFIVARFIGGLAAVTNLSQSSPWGIWVAIDVATGVALAAGGFTTAALAHIFGRRAYETVTRPALLTALLGYTFVPIALMIDIGRSWAIWHPIIYWQGNSVLFEVAMCVIIYTTVLYIEFIPIVAERFQDRVHLPGPFALLNASLDKLLQFADRTLDRVMWVFLLAGIVLSCMHQSGLGSLLLLAPTKLHDLWDTPLLPLLFLLSAIAVGFPMVIFENTLAAASLPIEDETPVLSALSRYTTVFLGLYGAVKVGDLMFRGAHRLLFQAGAETFSFLVEMLVGVIVPFILLMSPPIRRSRKGLFISSCMIIGGVVLNRLNVFLVGYHAPYAETRYFPSIGELAVTTALVAAIMFLYRVLVTHLPVLTPRAKADLAQPDEGRAVP